jgi:hypothetical protein
MSYSFSARGATKAEVMKQITTELDKVVAAQPIHAADRAQAQSVADAFLAIIPAIADKDFYVSVSGSVGWGGDKAITSASVNVSASTIAKP